MSLSGADIRKKFIDYFKDKREHLHLPSASLIPDNPTLLLTSAGMVPFVPYFLGQAPPPKSRIVTCQKSARAGGKDSDIENIGRTSRHHSFFEMLGNFSFGDYFKKEIIPWSFELVTKELGLDPDRISVTVFEGEGTVAADEEAYEIWHNKVGMPKERISRLGRADNFWGPPGPTGPCGPCSELYYDRGPDIKNDPGAEARGDRFIEIWNLVFMELFKDEEGKYSPLAAKNVDTGAGLDRLATVIQKKNNTFETDLLFPILQDVSKLSGVKYGDNPLSDTYLKIITDHARCVTFLVTDGVRTSNIGRGYVLRFIIRRAARFGRLLGLSDPFIYKLVSRIVEIYSVNYPELTQHADLTQDTIRKEEDRFAKTLDRGMIYLNELIEKPGEQLPGEEAFNLYATYGFPIELTKEIAEEKHKTIDMEAFAKAREEHEKVSSVNKFNVIITGEEALGDVLKKYGGTEFTGHDKTEDESTVIAMLEKGKLVEHAEEGEEFELILDHTPFYAESGGQLGDRGLILNNDARMEILDTKKHEGLIVHKARLVSGILEPGQHVHAEVDKKRRDATVRHHSTAHLFHAAVRMLLGKSVQQAGSQVGPDAMRFDFSYDRQLKPEEIQQVEELMNDWVRQNLPVKCTEMPLDEAKRTGAIAMFGEKYGDIVRVISMGDISLEFCGGTHVSNTGQIGPIKIISEGSIASGVRRVEALSGSKAWHYISDNMNILQNAAGRLRIKPQELVSQIDRLQEQLKAKERAAQLLEEKLAIAQAGELLANAESFGECKLVLGQVKDVSPDALKSLADHLRKQGEKIVAVLACAQGPEKLTLVAGVSDAAVKSGVNAGKLVKEAATICGGSGGGKPELAQAGGKDPSKIDAALAAVREQMKATCASASKIN
ncbi:MAG: alanine--tRNA ligase [Candidatus Obscuribacterales bacterium]|jgi:alanyl-tRNA synthetase|nr:alanine--tRNA ligase [Candidatus Obscuribacterales bacterium]